MAGAERPGHEVRLNDRVLILIALGATTALAWLPSCGAGDCAMASRTSRDARFR